MNANIWFIFGALGVLFTAIQLLPQVIKSMRLRNVSQLSAAMGVIIFLGSITWIVYGFHRRDASIVIANIINLAGAATLLYLKIKWHKHSS